ncbi:hypothetical protein SEA_MISHA28_56 [Mycobacterium phage Misha28]|nr:hypothetical protein SEA_MISHA28_56 [Mycobacterium phage Misha28]AVP42485.1 hypothetical protein SEA_TOOTSIEPOP_56 [Mycobacterium phage TootsiePop]QKO03241.1 hypothetical protein SEA_AWESOMESAUCE_58 [Mycobacterium phage Awesomesauce]
MSAQLCPMCGRPTSTGSGRYSVHSATGDRGDTCRMSRRPVPPTGLTPADHERRATLVTTLAWMVRDEDPSEVWDYLTTLDDAELQRLLVIALAAIDVERPASELWGWVRDLPVARMKVVAA